MLGVCVRMPVYAALHSTAAKCLPAIGIRGLIGYNGTLQIHPQNCPFPFLRSPPPSNTPIPRQTPLTIPNGIRIQLAILPQYTFRTDRQTDKPVGLSQNSVETLYAGNVEHHYTKISENSIIRNPERRSPSGCLHYANKFLSLSLSLY